jgi:uncharacterized protein (TIGR02145 family)
LEPTLADSKTISAATTVGVFTSLMENLSSGKTYYVRAYATNELGTEYGDVRQFSTANSAPLASNLSITGDLKVDSTITAVYTYSDAENDVESGSTFQWYVADDPAGSNETAINGATNASFKVLEEFAGKSLRFGIIPKAATGTLIGIEVKSEFSGPVGEPQKVEFIYNGVLVSYGIITSSVTGRKWLDRNLGAQQRPNAHNDWANYGDLFQWGRAADGHQLVLRVGGNDSDVSAVHPTSTNLSSSDSTGHPNFIVIPSSPFDWRSPKNNNLWQGLNGINNPCPPEWRIPTKSEWEAENLTGSVSQGFSQLKLTFTGRHSVESGNFETTSLYGIYWSSTLESNPIAVVLNRILNPIEILPHFRGQGYACRCIKD